MSGSLNLILMRTDGVLAILLRPRKWTYGDLMQYWKLTRSVVNVLKMTLSFENQSSFSSVFGGIEWIRASFGFSKFRWLEPSPWNMLQTTDCGCASRDYFPMVTLKSVEWLRYLTVRKIRLVPIRLMFSTKILYNMQCLVNVLLL